MNKFKSLFQKLLSREVILYVVFGIFTTIVNIATFYVLTHFFKLNENIANIISIVLAVIFAYLTNRKLVFNSTASTKKQILSEMCKFFSARLFTMLVEFFGCMFLFYIAEKNSIFGIFNISIDLVIKVTMTVIVIILNFFLSKFFAFKKK